MKPTKTHPVCQDGNRGPIEGKTTVVRGRRAPTVNDRERLRVALHDGLGQILTSISFLASSLSHKLAVRRLPEANEAQELLSLAGRAIVETKALVREPGEARSNSAGGS